MREIDVLACLPLPTQPEASIACGTVLFEELRVAAALGRVAGVFLKTLPQDHTRSVMTLTFTGRLTEAGLDHLNELQRRARGDA